MKKEPKFDYMSRPLVREALKRGYKINFFLEEGNLIQFQNKKRQFFSLATILPINSLVSSYIADHKNLTNKLLSHYKIPTPAQKTCRSLQDVGQFTRKYDPPYVIKPTSLSQGIDVYTNITQIAQLKDITDRLIKKHGQAIVENHIFGKDYRLLVVDGKFISAVFRTPANVTGDGIHTIKQLIRQENKNPLRSSKDDSILKTITIDDVMISHIQNFGYTPDSIPPKGKIIILKPSSNQSQGGEIKVVTKLVHQDHQQIAENAAAAIGLKFAGVDIIAGDITKRYTVSPSFVIEINSHPSVMIHHYPSSGAGDNVAKPIWDALEKYCF